MIITVCQFRKIKIKKQTNILDKKCDRIRGNIDKQILLEPLTLGAST